MILVPAGSPDGRDVGDPDAESCRAGLELGGAGDDTEEASPEDAESSEVDSDDENPQPGRSRQSTTAR